MRALAIPLLVVLASLLLPSRAHAEPAPVLRLSSPEGAVDPACISLDQLATSVARTLGRPALQTASTSATSAVADGRLDVKIAHHRAGWSATLAVRDAAGAFVGAREITRASASCHALDSALVLVAALLVDTLRAREADGSSRAPEARRPPRDETPIPVDAEPAAALAETARRSSAFTLDEAFGATFTGGAMPVPAFGVAGSSRIAAGPWLAGELAASWLPHAVLTARPGGTFDGGWATLGYCPTFAASSSRGASLVGCARGGLAVTRATGSGVDVSESSTLIYGLLGVAARGRVTLIGPLGASLELAGYAPLDRPEFFVRTGSAHGDVFAASRVFGAVSAFLEIRGL